MKAGDVLDGRGVCIDETARFALPVSLLGACSNGFCKAVPRGTAAQDVSKRLGNLVHVA